MKFNYLTFFGRSRQTIRCRFHRVYQSHRRRLAGISTLRFFLGSYRVFFTGFSSCRIVFSFVFLVLNCGLPDFRWARSDSSESNRVATNFPSNRLGLSVFVTFFKQFFLRYHRMELIPCISLDLEFFRNFISIFSSSTRAYWVLPSFT